MQSLEGSQESCRLLPSLGGRADVCGQVISDPWQVPVDGQAGDRAGLFVVLGSPSSLSHHCAVPITKKTKKQRKLKAASLSDL